MAGLSAYLAEHHAPVETLTLASPEGREAGFGSHQGTGQGLHQGAGQQTRQDTAQGADAGLQTGRSRDSSARTAEVPGRLPAGTGGLEESFAAVGPGSMHISVMA